MSPPKIAWKEIRQGAASLRWRIVLWITAVVVVTLVSVIFIARSLMLSETSDSANSAVEQEIGEFLRFVEEGQDPTTNTTFESPAQLIELYLSRQIPDDNEAIVGLTDGRLIQMDLSSLSGTHPAPLDPSEPLVHEVFDSALASGIYEDPERGRAHWGRISFFTGEDQPISHFAVVYYTAEARAAVASQVRMLSLIGVGGVVAAILIGWLIAGQIIAPLRRVREVAATINNTDLTQRVPVDGHDETAQLAQTFNTMLNRIETAYKDQRQFVDDAGHELRTPITVVRGQLELLESSPPEERARSIELATAELDRMSRMVNDLLTLAVADSGSFLHPADCDVAELAIDIEDKASVLSDRISLIRVAEGTVVLDEQRVTEAILELYGNALRYSDGPIDLASEYSGAGADRIFRIWVRDRGPGITPAQQERLFSRFTRGSHTSTTRPGGAGLGLSIVHAIGEAHGGRAFVESTVGVGSVFGLEIPAPEEGELP